MEAVSPTTTNACDDLVGTSNIMADLRAEIQQVAAYDSKVLVTGHSGVGKELVAQAIHKCSPRAGRPFVAMNCAGIPETLLESELFGHTRGSFTGAYRDQPGKLQMADHGTVFLDEIGEMTLRMQGLLLRFLETGEIQKVGSDTLARVVDVRIIAATNRNLRDMISEGNFREDLYYRINVVNLVIAPLCERRSDVPMLIDYFLHRLTSNGRSTLRQISPEAKAVMKAYAWPGNVRELMNVVERMSVSVRSEVAEVQDLPAEVQAGANSAPRPRRERRRTVADQLYSRLVKDRESFWTVVYPLYIKRPRFSWTRMKGESNVQGGGGNGSVERRGTGRRIGTDGGSPEGDWSPCRRGGGRGGLAGAGAAVERQPEARRGAAAAAWRIAGGAVP